MNLERNKQIIFKKRLKTFVFCFFTVVFSIDFAVLGNAGTALAVDGIMNGKTITGETDNYLFWLQTYDPTTAPYFFDKLFINKAGNVGINVSDPGAYKLNVNGNTNITGVLSATSFSGLYSGTIGAQNVSSGEFGSNTAGGNFYFGVTKPGNVGIGTTNPGGKLDISGSLGGVVIAGTNLDPTAGYSLTPLQNSMKMLVGPNRTAGGGETDFISNRGGGSVGGFNFYDYTNAGVLNNLVTIQGSGNVGIGTTAPGAKLDVSGDIRTSTKLIGYGTGSSNGLYLNWGTSGYATLYGSATSNRTAYFSASDAGIANFVVTNGNVGIGTTSPASAKLVIAPSGNSYSIDAGGGRVGNIISVDDSDAASVAYVKAVVGGTSTIPTVGYWTQSGSNIYNSNGGNVGIGTASPATKLDVNGDITAKSLLATISARNVSSGTFGDLTGWGNYNFLGNVGIGTTNPGAKLELTGRYNEAGLWDANNAIRFSTHNESYNWATGEISGYIASNQGGVGGYPGGLVFRTKNPNNVPDNSLLDRMVIDSNGNVGIGTINPLNKLQIGNNSASWAGNDFVISNGSNSAIAINNNTGAGYIWGSQRLDFYANSVNTMSLSSGNVGIGTTNPQNILHLISDSGNGIRFSRSDTTWPAQIYYDGAGSLSLFSSIGDSSVMTTGITLLKSSGNVGIGTTAPGAKLDVSGGAIKQDSVSKRVIVLNNGTANSGPGKWYVRLQPIGTDNIASVKITVQGTWNYSPVMGWLSGEYSYYVPGNGSIERSDFRVTSTTGDAYSNLRIGALVVENGYLSIPVWAINTNAVVVTLEYQDSSNLINNSLTATDWTAEALPALNFQSIQGDLNVSGTLTAGSFSGPYSGTIGAQNVSSGEFGANTGGGNFYFGATKPGNVGIGTTNPTNRLSIINGSDNVAGDSLDFATLRVVGPNLNMDSGASNGTLLVSTNDSSAIGAGGSIGLGGRWSSTQQATFAVIKGASENGEGNFAGYLSFGTRVHGGQISERMRINSSGSVGIGTTVPATKLSVVGQVTASQGNPYTNAGYSFIGEGGYDTGIFSTGDGALDLWSNNVNTLNIRTGNVGIGTAAPAAKLDVNGGTRIAGNLTMTGTANITGVQKITVNTIDPLYNIFGTNYASFAASVVGGVKEEVTGKLNLNQKIGQEYQAIINFKNQAKGSDLWVWRNVVDFNKDNVEAIITPYGSFANTYYYISGNSLVFRSDRPVEISYRLIAKRFDWQKWPTKPLNQTEKAGLIIK